MSRSAAPVSPQADATATANAADDQGSATKGRRPAATAAPPGTRTGRHAPGESRASPCPSAASPRSSASATHKVVLERALAPGGSPRNGLSGTGFPLLRRTSGSHRTKSGSGAERTFAPSPAGARHHRCEQRLSVIGGGHCRSGSKMLRDLHQATSGCLTRHMRPIRPRGALDLSWSPPRRATGIAELI